MRAELLFLRRYDQALSLTQALGELDLVDLAGILRQLIVDKHSLADTANKSRLKLLFTVQEFVPWSAFSPTELPSPILESYIDAIDAVGLGATRGLVQLNKDQFLGHTVLMFRGEAVTVKQTIKYAANVLGGRHLDPQNQTPELATVKAVSETFQLAGMPFAVRLIGAISRVTLRGLEPLVVEVRSRLT